MCSCRLQRCVGLPFARPVRARAMEHRRYLGAVSAADWEAARRERLRQQAWAHAPACDGDPCSRRLAAWVQDRATVVCLRCSSMVTPELEARALKQDQMRPDSIPSCPSCSQTTYPVPHPDAIPWVLRGLSMDAVRALRPCVLHQGEWQRTSSQGYLYATDVSGISWDRQSVPDKIAALPAGMRARAGRAREHLLASPVATFYRHFVSKHDAWLQRGAAEDKRWWPPSDIFAEGLECCLWPHLYCKEFGTL